MTTTNNPLTNTSILQGHGQFNFQAIDTVHLTYWIGADSRLYQRGNAGILLYQGQPNTWTVVSPPSLEHVAAGAASDAVYWELSDHSFWQYTPEGGTVEILTPFPGLQMAQPEWFFG